MGSLLCVVGSRTRSTLSFVAIAASPLTRDVHATEPPQCELRRIFLTRLTSIITTRAHMSRKRQRANEGVTEALPSSPPPRATSYFRYTPAPEDEQRDAAPIERYLRRAPNLRGGRRQRAVDKVDIPAPAEWLCHDAAASTKLLAQAQTKLQLSVPRCPSHLPHSEGQIFVRERDAGLAAAVKSTVGSTSVHPNTREMRPGRILCAGEVLPWGVWPARLRHHEGQSFYQEGDVFRDGDGVGRRNYLVSGGSAGRSGGVGGVGSVSEGSIHDELLRREFPSSPASCSSTYQHPEEETAVTRLVPDKRGRWAEVKSKGIPTIAAALPSEMISGSDASLCRLPSPPPPGRPAAEPAPIATDSGGVVKCLIPGRYGGWVEVEEKVVDRARNSTRQRQRRHAAATRTARFGPDSTGGAGIPDAALPSSYPEEKYVRRMVAEAAVAAAATAARGAQEQRREGSSQQGARVGTVIDDAVGRGGSGQMGGGGGSWRSGVTVESAEGTQRTNDGDGVAGSGGFGKGRADDGKIDDDEKSLGGCRRGWTVSEPAKETVRRVWNRARRRARDSSEPRHRASRASVDKDVAAAEGGAIRDDLGAGLLSCLGRECEGIIDAALHVVLGDRLRLLRYSSSPVASSTAPEEKQRPAQQPPPLVTADWQGVLRAMRNCSEGARGVRATAAIAPFAAQRDGDRQSASLGAMEGRGGGTRGIKGARVERGREGVPGRGEMERTLWGAGDSSDGSVVVVNERLPGLPLNEVVLTRAYNRLLLYLHEKKTWLA